MRSNYYNFFLKGFLLINALMYLWFSLYCLLKTGAALSSLGQQVISQKGLVEFIAVYVGMELALSLIYLLAIFRKNYTRAILLFSVILYGCLALFRLGAVALTGFATYEGYGFLLGESALLIIALVLLNIKRD